MNNPRFPQTHTHMMARVSMRVLQAAQERARKEHIDVNQMAERALILWSGCDKPLPIPVPFIITKIEEP